MQNNLHFLWIRPVNSSYFEQECDKVKFLPGAGPFTPRRVSWVYEYQWAQHEVLLKQSVRAGVGEGACGKKRQLRDEGD